MKELSITTLQPGITLSANLKLRERTLEVQAKIDTGASCCIFERSLGEALGFSIESGLREVFGTATGTFVAYGHEVTLKVADFEFNTIAFFPSDEGITRNVLGRFGWLDHVVLRLVDYDGRLYLTPYGE